MKKYIRGILSLILSLTMFCALGASLNVYAYECDDEYGYCYNEKSDGTLSIVGFRNKKSSVVNIPETIKDKVVTEIAQAAFKDNKRITKVNVPESVTTIRQWAFSGCSNLTEIKLPDNINLIEKYAFENCSLLKNVNIPKNITKIGYYVFKNCSSIDNIDIPSNVKYIIGDPFSGCVSLNSITVAADNKYFVSDGDVLFNIDKTRLIFASKKIENYTVPDGVEYIEEGAFYQNKNLKSIVLPEGLKTIYDHAFYGCSNLTSITFPSGLEIIRDDAFSGCKSLSKITFNDDLKTIKSGAFFDCDGLTNITIPSGVETIEEKAFAGCKNITGFSVSSKNSYYKAIDGILFDKSGYTLLACPASKSGSYSTPNTVRRIGAYAFYECDKITDVTVYFSQYAPSVGDYAFFGCGELKSYKHVFFKDSGTYQCSDLNVGYKSFSNCTKLETVSLNTMYTIKSYAFENCTSLKNIRGISDISVILTGVFKNCTSLTEMDIPKGVTEICPEAFSGCINLSKVTLNNNLTSIYSDAFANCTSLTSINIPASVKLISANAFDYCSNLTDVNISNEVSDLSIESNSFYGCNKIISIYIPAGVKVPSFAIEGCGGLLNAEIDEAHPSECSIDGVIYNKNKNTLVSVPEGISGPFIVPDFVEIIGGAFHQCDKIKSVVIPKNVVEIRGNMSAAANLEEIIVDDNNSTYKSVDGLLIEKKTGNLICIPSGIEGKIVLPDEVCSMEYSAFERCRRITDIVLSNNMDIKRLVIAFKMCKNLDTISVLDDNPLYSYDNGVLFNKDKTEILYCSRNKTGEYVIPDGVESIGEYAFFKCNFLESVVFPRGLKKISLGAFYDCDSLTSVMIPARTETIISPRFGYYSYFSDYYPSVEGWYYTDSTFTVYGYEGTYAEIFANNWGYNFEAVYCSHEETELKNYKKATCVQNGYSGDLCCVECLKTLKKGETTVASIHDGEVTVSGYPATCTTSGLTDGVYCNSCGKTVKEQEIIPALGHDEEVIPGYAASCTESGKTEGIKCARCGEIIKAQTSISALGHSFENYVPDNNATCTADGTKTAKCIRCDATETVTDVGSSKGHTLVTDKSVDPTCTESGLTEGSHCSVCGKTIEKQEVIPALGHEDENDDGICDVCDKSINPDADCDKNGHTDSNKDGVCDKCGETMPEVKNCTCICHKSSRFAKFIYKLFRFFWRIFGMNKSCACGKVHY